MGFRFLRKGTPIPSRSKTFGASQPEAAIVISETKRWIASSKGQETIRRALAAANRTTQRRAEVRSVNREALHEPVTR